MTIGRIAAGIRTACLVGLALVLSMAAPARASAEGARYAVLIQGASGGEPYTTRHREWLDRLATMLRDDFGYDAAHLLVLAEKPKDGEQPATAASVREVFERMVGTLATDDQLVVVLIGHGSNQGSDTAKFNLVGPDLSVEEWKALLAPIPGRMAVVDTTSGSFPFLAGLSSPGRVVITATSSAAQRFHTEFPDGFLAAFSDDEADLDKDGRVSLLEAFTYASRHVAQYYEQKSTMATETALLDDNGDGKGRIASAEGDDGSIAALTYLGGVVLPTSTDPEVQALLARQRALTEQVDELRRKQGTMPAEQYQREFEQLMLDLAQVSAEVRKKTQ